MDEMTHERCSELLGGYARGELSRDLAGEVRSHLDACEDCRAEEGALTALLAPGAPALDDVERARLHRALTQELFAPPANVEMAGTSDAAWKRWIAPALGSAAAVLIALLVVTGGIVGSGDDSPDAAGQSVETLEAETDGGAADSFESGAGGGGSKPKRSGQVSAAAGEATTKYDAAGPQPEFDPDAGELTPEELASIGRESPLFQSFANRYTVDDASALRGSFLRRLVGSSGEASAQARRCARTLPEEEPILPAYGATGKYDGRDALVLGFVTTDTGSALDRYLMWVWAKGSCRQPVDTLFERIDN